MPAVDLTGYAGLFSPGTYGELRVQESRNIGVTIMKGNVVGNSRSARRGVSARVYDQGGWGFASEPMPESEVIRRVVREATENAVLLGKKGRVAPVSLPETMAHGTYDFSTKAPRLSQGELIEFARELDSAIDLKYPGLTSRIVSMGGLDMEKSLLTSHGTHTYSMIPRSIIFVRLSTDKGGEPVEVMGVYGGMGHFEDVFTSPSELLPGMDDLYRKLMDKAEAVYAEAGTHTCILGSKLAGILAHEAIGHTVEADWILNGSVAAGWMGRQVASPMVTMVDYAHTYEGKPCPVPVHVDDEGTPGEDAVLIKDGILTSYMHNKETAAKLGLPVTGNARAWEFSDEPLVRMRNTAILPGTDKLGDMIASVDDGYYLMDINNGQADSTSEFMFGITMGYEIKDGKLGKAIKDTTISGIAFDVLKSVSMLSDEMTWECAGMCGKKQPIPVGMGGPSIKCQVGLGGR